MNRRKTQHYLFWGLTLTGVLLALFIIGWFWTPYDPAAMNGAEKNLAPSLRHLFGTDLFGRDIFSRVLKGGGTTLFVALCALAIGGGAGITLGALTGYFGGWLDRGLMRLNDVITAFPSILLALVLISVLGPGKINLILALGIVFIPSYARMSRSAFAACRDKNYVISARLMGAGSSRILLGHILPNTGAVLLPAVTIGFNNVVLAEASMSYLGIGITLPDTSLGYMLSDSQQYLSASPWYALCTGGTIVLLILGVGLIGEGLQRRSREG